MYNVVEDLYSLNTINIIDPYKKEIIKTCNINSSVVKLYNTEIHIGLDMFNPKWNDVYNNVILSNDGLDSELIILQDYGDYEGEVPDGFLEIDRVFPFTDVNTSVGWYDNHLVLISSFDGVLYVYKLIKYPKINICELNGKRPYTFKVLVSKDYSEITPICVYVEFKLKDKGYKHVLESISILYYEITTPQHLNEVVESRFIEEKYKEQFLTRDDFVINNFCYDSSIKCWKKDSLCIFDDCKPFSGCNFCMHKEGKTIILYTKRNLENLLK